MAFYSSEKKTKQDNEILLLKRRAQVYYIKESSCIKQHPSSAGQRHFVIKKKAQVYNMEESWGIKLRLQSARKCLETSGML